MAPQVLGSPPTERVRDDIKGAKIPLAVQFVLEKDLKSRLAFFYRENNLAKLVSVAEEILKSSVSDHGFVHPFVYSARLIRIVPTLGSTHRVSRNGATD